MNKLRNFYTMGDPADIERKARLETVSTVLLSLATLALAWCSYQAALWNGIESVRMAQSNRENRLAQQYQLIAAQQQEIDAFVALHFLDAVIENKTKNINYYLNRGQPGLITIMANWLKQDPLHNTKAPAHPLAMEEYAKFRMASHAASDSASARGNVLWNESRRANNISDRYTFLTVLFSLVMFLGAIATKTSEAKTGRVILTLAGLLFVTILTIQIILMPVTTSGG